MQPILVSVLMTAYNREKYISEAIESVLASKYTNFELIIVDDCSKDNTVEIAKSYEARDNRIKVYVNEVNLGDYPNRNRAASYAKGKYLKYVDSDDKIFPQTLEIMVSTMESNPEAAFGVSSRYGTKTEFFNPYEAYYCHFFNRGLLDYGPTGAIINKSKFDEVGGFLGIRNVSDIDLWLRLAAKYPMLEMPKGLVFWREHAFQEIKLAPEFYLSYYYNIVKTNLENFHCPLSKIEKKKVLKKIKKDSARAIIKTLIKTKKVKLSYSFWKQNELKLFDLLN